MTLRIKVLLIAFSVVCFSYAAYVHFKRIHYERIMLEENKVEELVRQCYIDEYGREPTPGALEMELREYREDPVKFKNGYKAKAEARRAKEQQVAVQAAREEEARAKRATWITVTVMLSKQFDQDGDLGFYEAVTSGGEHCVVSCPERVAKIGRLMEFKAVKSPQNFKFTQTVRNNRTGASWEQPIYLPGYAWMADQ